MPRYRIVTPATPRAQGRHYPDFEAGRECNTTEAAAAVMRPHGFDGCAVWRYVPRARHWEIIFDTTQPNAARLPAPDYWFNVATAEHLPA